MTETLVATADSIETMVHEELADEFHILAPLGWARWGIQFRAEDVHRSEVVTLTALPAIDPADPAEGERFLEALRAAALLDHPHLVPLCGYGVCGPLRWFSTPPTEEATLAARLAGGGALPLPEVRRIAQQLASALDQAHRRGVAHGALSTNEILIDQAGWVRVLGVGIAAGLRPQGAGRSMTARVAQGSDQAEFARILHACLTGGSSTVPLSTDIPAEVERALRRGTHPRTTERFHDLLDLVRAIEAPGEGGPVLSSAAPPWHGGGANAWDAFLGEEELEPPPRPLVLWGRRGIVALVVALCIVMAIEGGRSSFPSTDQEASAVVAEEPLLAAAPAPPPAVVPSPPTPAPTRVVTAAPKRTPRPAVRAAAPAAERPVVLLPSPPALSPANGTLSVSSFPWGELSVDGRAIGNTPQSGIILRPGTHTLRIARDGYQAYETTFELPPGARIRLTQVTLQELTL